MSPKKVFAKQRKVALAATLKRIEAATTKK